MTRAAHPPHVTRPSPPVRVRRFLPPLLAGRGGGCGRAAKMHRKTPLPSTLDLAPRACLGSMRTSWMTHQS
eukprot:5605102-Alexandrium_andersonii.AAC.1